MRKAAPAPAEKKKTATKSAPARKKPAPAKASPGESEAAAFYAALDHPLKKDIGAARAILLHADKSITEGVKWNSLSFKTADYFATVNLRSLDAVQFVFHRGAKSIDGERDLAIKDPRGLVKWLSSDRALVTLGRGADIAANAKPFAAIVKAWVRQL